MIMYDSIDVAAIPADATDLLGYTDGIHANIAALRARFPNARIHTISAVGQLFAEWVDCEPGCVWPPSVAASVLRAWQPEGCKGIYASLDNMPAVKEAVNTLMLQNVEYFDADATNIVHVDRGYVATQYGQGSGYDISDTTATFEADPLTVSISGSENRNMAVIVHPSGTRVDEFVCTSNGQVMQRTGGNVGQLNTAPWSATVPGAWRSIGGAWWPDGSFLVMDGEGVNGLGYLTWFQVSTGAWELPLSTGQTVYSLAGPQGAPGPAGPAGPQGPAGVVASGTTVTVTGTLTTT